MHGAKDRGGQDRGGQDRDVEGLDGALWRALAVFRSAALVYAGGLVVWRSADYAHPAAGWVVLAGMAAWTGFVTHRFTRPAGRTWPVLWADLLVAAVLVVASREIVGTDGFRTGVAIVPVTWHAAPVLAWAVQGGRRLGLAAAVVLGGCDLYTRWGIAFSAVTGAVLLVLAAASVGYVVRLATRADRRLREAVRLEREAVRLKAAARERSRLARDIHDSVLQVLALVQRRGSELGGEAAELGRLAGEQEATLRAMVGAAAPADRADPADPAVGADGAGGPVDLTPLLDRFTGPLVTLAAPAGPVPVPAPVADAVTGAVAAALSNVRRHAGPDARAWVLVEAEPGTVTVSVRDDGPGMAPGRLAAAAADGRLGVSESIRGRVAEVGGQVTIDTAPGQGTEVELRIPLG